MEKIDAIQLTRRILVFLQNTYQIKSKKSYFLQPNAKMICTYLTSNYGILENSDQ